MKFLFLCLAVIVTFAIESSDGKKDRIKLKDIQVLTLHHGQWTTGRRTRPVPQLQCIGGTAMCKTLPQTIQCYNRGTDGVDIQWECKADLDTNLRFNKIEVTCEGYDFPEDDYVLMGSCGLEYSIDTVDGKRPFPEPRFDRPDPRNIPKSHQQYNQKKDEPGFWTVAVLASIAFFMYVIYKSCIVPLDESRRRQRTQGSSGPSAPPPPPGFKFETAGDSGPSTAGPTPGEGPGFWSGLGLGTFLGYIFSPRNDGANQGMYPNLNPDAGYTRTTRREYTEPAGGSGWGNFWSGSTTRRRNWGSSSTTRDPSPKTSSTPPSPSGEVSRNASGFGGTKRR